MLIISNINIKMYLFMIKKIKNKKFKELQK